MDDSFGYGILCRIEENVLIPFAVCPQALSTENGAAWIEAGCPVEQGKEAVQWMKLGWLL